MYDLSGTGKKGGLEYQLDLRIRHTCFKAIGHNDGLFNTVVIKVSNTRAFIYEDFQNPLGRGSQYILFTIAEGRLVGIYPSVSLAYRQESFLSFLSEHSLIADSFQPDPIFGGSAQTIKLRQASLQIPRMLARNLLIKSKQLLLGQ